MENIQGLGVSLKRRRAWSVPSPDELAAAMGWVSLGGSKTGSVICVACKNLIPSVPVICLNISSLFRSNFSICFSLLDL
jgi:hypothetical protein